MRQAPRLPRAADAARRARPARQATEAPGAAPGSSRGAGFLRAVFMPPFVCGADHGALVLTFRARHSHNHFHFRLFRESISGSLSRRHLRQYCIELPQASLPRCGVEVRHVQPPSALSVTMNAAEFCCLSETVNTGCFSGDETVEDTALLRTSNERRPPALFLAVWVVPEGYTAKVERAGYVSGTAVLMHLVPSGPAPTVGWL